MATRTMMKLKTLASRAKKGTVEVKRDEESGQGDDALIQRYGLFELSHSNSILEDTVDLIAVHGLGGDRSRTWQDPDTKAFWLRDFLPSHTQSARIMTYGYDSKVAFSKSIVGLVEFARDLLERLKIDRETGSISNRPIIFICHSMGGLVVKKALILAHERSSIYGSLLDSIFGVIFLATPHRGSSFAAPAELVSRFLRYAQLGSGTNTELLSSLRRDAKILGDISAQFVDRAAQLHIRTFYETEVMPFMSSLIVDKSSAVLNHPNETAAPVKANHRTICQFPHRDCQNYSLVRAAIQDLCAKARSNTKRLDPSEVSMTKLIQRLHKSDYEGYKAAIELPIQDTCAWFLDESNYVEWIQSSRSSILWISGDPGCGKTTLARLLLENIQGQISQRRIVATLCYFFFDEKIETQSNGASLLLAFIHQPLKANPHLVTAAEKHLAPNDSQIAMNLHTLWETFKAVASEIQNIVCVVDALDECEVASMNKVVRWLSSYIDDRNSTAESWFKVVVTSRRYQSIDDIFRTIPHIRSRVDDHADQTSRDIEKFIMVRSARIQKITLCSESMRSAIVRRLLERCDRTFLWISLILDILERDTDSSQESFDRIFADLPQELDGVYERILQRSTEPEALIKILSVIVASRRPLSAQEINNALAVRRGDKDKSQVERRHQFDIFRRLHGVCGPFIRVSNDTVSLIHQTAKEFLVRPPGIQKPIMQSWKYCLELSQANRILAEMCMVYLNLCDAAQPGNPSDCMDLDQSGDDDDDYGNSAAQTAAQYQGGLFDYAAKHWAVHCRLGSVLEEDELFTRALCLCDTSTETFCSWFQLYWSTISSVPQFPDGLTSLMMAAHLGFHSMARILTDNGAKINSQDSEGWAAIHWAVWNGHGTTVDTTTVQQLLESGAIVNLQDNKGLTALHWAAADAQEGVVSMLLNANAEIDILDHDGLTPLALAVENECIGTVELLVDHGANINATGEGSDWSVEMQLPENSDEGMAIDHELYARNG